MKALQITTSLNMSWESSKTGNGWALRFIHHKQLVLDRRAALAQRLPTDNLEKLIVYQQHIIRLQWKHDYVLGQMGRQHDTFFSYVLTNTTGDTKGSKSELFKTTGNEKLRTTAMLSVLADERKQTLFVILKRKNLLKEKAATNGVIFNFNEKGWILKKRGMLMWDAAKGN